MKTYEITFEENGNEYTGYLKVKCNELKQINENTFKADEVMITLDENIINIEELSQQKAVEDA